MHISQERQIDRQIGARVDTYGKEVARDFRVDYVSHSSNVVVKTEGLPTVRFVRTIYLSGNFFPEELELE